MLSSIIINIIVSIFIIIGIQYGWNYLKDNYTHKKTKDLVNIQIQKYKKMVQEIQDAKSPIPFFKSDDEKTQMSNELHAFMESQIKLNLTKSL